MKSSAATSFIRSRSRLPQASFHIWTALIASLLLFASVMSLLLIRCFAAGQRSEIFRSLGPFELRQASAVHIFLAARDLLATDGEDQEHWNVPVTAIGRASCRERV